MRKNNKDIIINNAIKLFYELGYEKTTVRKIAELSGIAHQSIFNHYKSKSEIADILIYRYLHSLIKLTQKCIENNIVDISDKRNLPIFFWVANNFLMVNNFNFMHFLLDYYKNEYDSQIAISQRYFIEAFNDFLKWDYAKNETDYQIDARIIVSCFMIIFEDVNKAKKHFSKSTFQLLSIISVVAGVDLNVTEEKINEIIEDSKFVDIFNCDIFKDFLLSNFGESYTNENINLLD